MSAAWLSALTALAAAAAGLALWGARQAWRILSRMRDFLDDWGGQPARPGVEARPGVMARLQTLEAGLAAVLADLGAVKEQVARLTGRPARRRDSNHA